MYEERKFDQLTLMYDVFRKGNNVLKILSTGLRNYIEIQGQIISTDDLLLNDPVGFTQSLLKFQEEMDAMVTACFQKDREFLKARDLAFKRFMNESDKIPYYLAIFID